MSVLICISFVAGSDGGGGVSFLQVQGPFVFLVSRSSYSAHSSTGSWVFPRLLDSVSLNFSVFGTMYFQAHFILRSVMECNSGMLVMRMDLLSGCGHGCLIPRLLQN